MTKMSRSFTRREHGVAEPGRAERALDRDRTGEDEAEEDARKGDDREQRVGERVHGDDKAPIHPLGTRRAHVVFADHLKQTTSGSCARCRRPGPRASTTAGPMTI